MLGRYFYFESNGSSANRGNHINEVQIVDKDGVNLASGRGVFRFSTGAAYGTSGNVVTDGNINNYLDFGEGQQHIVIDLGAVYDISYIKVWRYTGRYYKDVFVKVSTDDIEYTTVFSSAENGTYTETSAGYQIDLPLCQTKYLLLSNNVVYTVIDGVLSELQDAIIESSFFINNGFEEFPEPSMISELINPKLLLWTENEYVSTVTKATLIATPYPQSIITNSIDLSHPTIIGINSITGECAGSPLFSCEFNGVWKEHDGTSWVDSVSGMTYETLSAITPEQWDEMITGLDSFKIKVVLDSADDKVTKLNVNYNFDVTQAVTPNEEVISDV